MMEFAKSEVIQRPSRLSGWFVGEGVNVGLCVDVSVGVGDSVTVAFCEAVGMSVGVFVSVMTILVAVGKTTVDVCVAVAVGGTDGVKRKLEINASRRRMPIMRGKADLRSSMGKVVAGTTGSPAYPNVASRRFRLAA